MVRLGRGKVAPSSLWTSDVGVPSSGRIVSNRVIDQNAVGFGFWNNSGSRGRGGDSIGIKDNCKDKDFG